MRLKHHKNMELKEAFEGLAKSLNLTETEVSALYSADGIVSDDAFNGLITKQTTAAQAARDKAKADRDEQYKRGLREKGTEYEKLLKDAGVELEDEKGADAVQKLKDHIAAQTKPSDLDDDKVKQSPLFLKREKELLAQITAKDAEHAKYIQERDAKEQRTTSLNNIKAKREDMVKTLNPVLPSDPEKARRQMRTIDMDIEQHTYSEEDGVIYVIDKDGKRVETSTGIPLTVDQFVEGLIKATFDIPVSTEKSAAGDVTKGTVQKGAKLQKPANRQELGQRLYEISEDKSLKPEEKVEMTKTLTELAKDLA